MAATPTAEQIADRADVSVARPVYRYFESLDELRQVGVQPLLRTDRHLIAIPDIGVGPLPDRIDALVGARLDFYRSTEPISRMSRRRHPTSPCAPPCSGCGPPWPTRSPNTCAARTGRPPDTHRQRDRVAVIAALTSFEAWDLLHDQGLDRAAIRQPGAPTSPSSWSVDADQTEPNNLVGV
ncbi:MAG: TetR/AcrR family transcriptional regulator [Ilumatobacteraceae bacterium]